MPPPPVIQWLKQHYPRPSVDPEWLDACCGWISDEKNLSHATNFDEYIKEVETQLLRSSLTDSMVAGTGLPPNTSEMVNGKISGKPVLVELTSITEIAHSAFSLQNTRQTMIDRADLAGLTEEDEDEEGRVTKYPRGMLHLTLSDGVTKVKAIEYRSLPDLELGVTPLGYKMLLRDVSVRGGIVFLEPRTVTLLGHYTEDLEEHRDEDFLRSLRGRLGQPEPPPEPQNDIRMQPPAAPPVVAARAAVAQAGPIRSPLRELSDPPEPPVAGSSRTYHDDEDQPRRRKIPNRPAESDLPLTSASTSSSTLVQSSYFSRATPSSSSSRAQSNASAVLQRERILSPARLEPIVVDSDEDEPIIMPSISRIEPPSDLSDTSSDYFGEMDEALLEQADIMEREALNTQTSSRTRHSPDVIVIEDDEEDDKENVPVRTRHVRRRTARSPVAIDNDDVIDISE